MRQYNVNNLQPETNCLHVLVDTGSYQYKSHGR